MHSKYGQCTCPLPTKYYAGVQDEPFHLSEPDHVKFNVPEHPIVPKLSVTETLWYESSRSHPDVTLDVVILFKPLLFVVLYDGDVEYVYVVLEGCFTPVFVKQERSVPLVPETDEILVLAELLKNTGSELLSWKTKDEVESVANTAQDMENKTKVDAIIVTNFLFISFIVPL